MTTRTYLRFLLALFVTTILAQPAMAKKIRLLNFSYDPTRELYEEDNAACAKYWEAKPGDKGTINQSPGGSASRLVPSSTGCKPTW